MVRASLLVPRRARHEVGPPAVETDLREAALGGEPADDAPGVVGKAPGAAAVVARQATGFHVQVGDTLAESNKDEYGRFFVGKCGHIGNILPFASEV